MRLKIKQYLKIIGLMGFFITTQGFSTNEHQITPQPTYQLENQGVEQSYQQAQEIVLGKDYSVEYKTKVWKKTRTTFIEDWIDDILDNINDWLSENLGVKIKSETKQQGGIFSKTVVLLLLLMGIIWLYKNRQFWLAWFVNLRLQSIQKQANLDEDWYQQKTDTGHPLPEKQQLSYHIHQALQHQQWLLALSLLYRGTLREIVQLYHLPINQASTEQQCEWLLLHAAQQQTDESTFFQQLVAIWSQVAYGKKIPENQNLNDFSDKIKQLLISWEKLYLSHGQGE